ncbi:MAG: DUF4326 domain-containing protein [Oxalobacteraceae bacterium]|nr:DUF4326 domain-containing protein [Oxalobacteraceae bacterium]
MNKVLILYPPEFQSQSKFDRKAGHITSKMQDYCIVFPFDKNDLIKNLFSSKLDSVNLIQAVDWEPLGITHAIIFDDGEVFPDEVKKIEAIGIPFRLIRIQITRVVNIKKETKFAGARSTPDYEYIGRGAYWGNPYSLFAESGNLEEVIRKYKYDFDYEKFPNKEKSEIYKLAGKRLGCFCKPDACHGDILADFLNKWDDGK